VLRRRLGVQEVAEVGDVVGNPVGCHRRPVSGLSHDLLAVKTLHRRLPCRHIPVDFKAAGGLLSLPRMRASRNWSGIWSPQLFTTIALESLKRPETVAAFKALFDGVLIRIREA
jgi:hypothetical protein